MCAESEGRFQTEGGRGFKGEELRGMQRAMMERVLELEARRHQSPRSFKRHHGRGRETKEGNLAGQMERLPNPLDSSHVSIWKRAHRKSLEEGKRSHKVSA